MYDRRPRKSTCFSLKKRRLRDYLMMSSMGGYRKDKSQFLLKHCGRTGHHGHILQQCKFQLVISKLFLFLFLIHKSDQTLE